MPTVAGKIQVKCIVGWRSYFKNHIAYAHTVWKGHCNAHTISNTQ